MNREIIDSVGDQQPVQFYHGARTKLKPGDLIQPGHATAPSQQGDMTAYVYLTPNLDAAIWAAELVDGEAPSCVYTVEPTGQIEHVPESTAQLAPGGSMMAYRSRQPLRVTGEVTEWRYYHGTRADLKLGDLIEPGHRPNYGDQDRTTAYVYFTRTLDAATWGAELAAGGGPGRIYIVEPTGPFENDPNLTDKRFRGNPTKSFRSRAPLRVTGEVTDWQGHAAESIKAMKDGLEQLAQRGVEPIED